MAAADCSARAVYARRSVDPRVSCFTLAELRRIADSSGVPWSERHSRARIKASIAEVIGDADETSWATRVEFLRRNPFVSVLAFRAPRPDAWLNENDINLVMAQFASTRGGAFRFHGTHPVDFRERTRDGKCVKPPWCDEFAVASVFEPGSASQRGWVFNTDRHDQGGSHWVALYVCTDPASRKYGSVFFNSVGAAPPAQIQEFMLDIRAASGDPLFPLRYSPARLQFGNRECGVFVISYLVACARARTLRQAIRDCAPSDAAASRLRSVLFSGRRS